MPVLETDFLKGIIDPKDELHPQAKKAMVKVRHGEWSGIVSTIGAGPDLEEWKHS